MKPTDNIYQLIKSLSGSEKRYFKVFSKRHVINGANKYEKLFDIYDSLPDTGYDEAELKKQLKKGFSKNLADDKKNLQEMIMKAMLSFHSGNSVDNQLNDLLAEEDFYRQKRLNDLRRKTIAKAKDLAAKYERYTVLLALIDREIRFKTEMNPDELIEFAKTFEKEKRLVLEKIHTASILRSINSWFLINFRVNPGNATKSFWNEAEARLNDPVMKLYKAGLSYTCDVNYYKIWAIYFRMKKDHIKHNDYTRMVYECYERYPLQKINDRSAYKIALYNYVASLFAIYDYDNMRKMLDHAASIEALNEDEAGEDFQNITFYRQMYYTNTWQYAEAVKMANEINEGIKKYRTKVNKARELAMYNNIAIAYLMIENWDDMLTYTEKILMDKTDVRLDIKYRSMLYQLIAHYEMNNHEMLLYLLRNTERLLKKREAFHQLEESLIKVLDKLLKHGKDYFRTREAEAKKMASNLLARDELNLWFRSHCTRIPISVLAKDGERQV